jgi:hypothetical protein
MLTGFWTYVPSVRGVGGSFVPCRYLWGSILQLYGGYANRLLATTLTLGRRPGSLLWLCYSSLFHPTISSETVSLYNMRGEGGIILS